MRHASALKTVILTLLLTLLTTSTAVAFDQYPEPFELKTGDRVVLLGGTFIERAQRYGWLETSLHLRFPKADFTVRNLGWSGDTVFAESRGIFDAPDRGYQRMVAQVRDLKPTVIFLNYGANEAFNGPEYLSTFLGQYEKLINELKSDGAQVVLIGPLPLWERPQPLPTPTTFNQHRLAYSEAIGKLAEKLSVRFVDSMELLSGTIPFGRHGVGTNAFTQDGVTLTDMGNLYVAQVLFQSLFTARLRSNGVVVESSTSVRPLSQRRDKDLPAPEITTEATPDGIQIAFDMRTSGYGNGLLVVELHPDFGGDSHVFLVNGEEPVLLPGNRKRAAIISLVDPLRKAIVEKNMMYFHQWRPQNITYLFLFRKHEQGNNAKDVDEFRQLVAKQERQIFGMKQDAGKVNVEITRMNDGSTKE